MPSSLNLSGVFADAIAEHLTIVRQFVAQEDAFERAAVRITDCLLAGNKILWCGNGGSAADSQHLAAESDASARRVAPFLPSPLPPTLRS
jgi:D-sedoheptulose 7-phosphate isomerase